MNRLLFLTLAVTTSAALAKPIVVASKLDPEAQLLGQMILLTLRDAGLDVTDKTGLGDTGVARKAILSGEIDVYPEYTGNAVYLFPDAKINLASSRNPRGIYALAKKYDAKNGITWLQPANVNNTWALALPAKFAQANKLSTYADLAAYLKRGGTLKVAGSPEFFNRPDAFKLFERTYGFTLTSAQKLTLAGATPLQTQQAAASGQSGVNAAMAYGTDGTISALNLITLKDPKNAQPVYQPAPIIRTDVLKANPKIEGLLNKAFGTLDQTTIQRLNAQIAVEGRSARDVASAYLKSKGLLK
ncbi:ABC transporter substrate-binding protein [Deinococcus maricopensis]|uniref:ABC-type glycine betaine transport, periplasmic subunit n=1 Tax=Deinococcus maricopensis (strain DSM 21211 / LMG 22137 / NRRL B-23946 / LB-34) TaxID=709986 RepID=E8U6K5_DEIML|nr:ABC transporter substrate-binding protein [Deinococcus maricopensis]ADV66694.1 ABC-type glycine betaine transport, periplasmic subunit [Deinococcus maricopensis DSM 21211]